VLIVCVNVRDGVMILGAGVNLAVSAELHYVIGKLARLGAAHCFFSLSLSFCFIF